jgi:hypothetical protein
LERCGDVIQKIEQPGVDGFDFLGSMIPQDVIDTRQGRGTIIPLAEITNFKAFAGVSVIKGKMSLWG